MKKIVLTSVCALAMAGVAFAQGTVNYGAISPAGFTMVTNSTAYSPLFGGGSLGSGTTGATALTPGGFLGALLYTGYTVGGPAIAQPTSVASLATWTATGLTATNGVASTGKLAPVQTSTQAIVPWANGVTNSIMMVAWSANLGSTWAEVLANLQNPSTLNASLTYLFGMSATGYINPATGNPGAGLFGNSATSSGLPIFSLNTPLYVVPVPEPSTLVLAGLGGLSLLAFRRKK